MKVNYLKVFQTINEDQLLKKAYNWYIKNCTTMQVPYHNQRHTLGMIYHIICLHERSHRESNAYGFNLTDADLRELIISALFHDYGHSAGRFDDKVNIENAKRGLRACLGEIMSDIPEADALVTVCAENIDATQYPYVVKDSELTLHQRILRECDILVAFNDDFITQNVFGLAEEAKASNLKEYFEVYMNFIEHSINNLNLTYSLEVCAENMAEFKQTVNTFNQTISTDTK